MSTYYRQRDGIVKSGGLVSPMAEIAGSSASHPFQPARFASFSDSRGMRQRAAGAHCGGDGRHLRQFLPAGAGAQRAAGMDVDAVFALGGEGDRDRDQFADFWRDRAVGPERRMVELEEGLGLARRQLLQRRYQREIRTFGVAGGGHLDSPSSGLVWNVGSGWRTRRRAASTSGSRATPTAPAATGSARARPRSTAPRTTARSPTGRLRRAPDAA
jgi:hypothetical protein